MVPRVFFLHPISTYQINNFHELLGSSDDPPPLPSPPSPLPPGGRRITLYALDPIRKGGYAALGVGRWHIITQAAGQQGGVGACSVWACVYMCILLLCCPPLSLWFFCGPRPARGDRSDPTTLDF
jgi:hypothetical protein